MIENGVLWVSHPELMLERVAGLSVLERQLFTAARAGLKRLWIAAKAPKDLERLRLPAGLELRWVAREGDPPSDCQPPFAALSGDHFVRVETLRHILGAEHAAHAAYLDPDGASVVQIMPYRWEKSVSYQKLALPEGCAVRLSKPVSAALPWLLTTGPKAADGFMSRHFDRHISLTVSRALLDTKVSPNMMTVVSSLIGIAGATFFLRRGWGADVAAALLIWLHSVLDGCDGELARIRFQESKIGGILDFWGDNLVHVALFGCLGWGYYQADHSLAPLILGAAAGVSTIGSATLAYLQKLEGKGPLTGKNDGTALSKLETMLAQRDFIYALIVLAYFGLTYQFLWAAGIGSVLFFFLMLYLRPAKQALAVSKEAHQ